MKLLPIILTSLLAVSITNAETFTLKTRDGKIYQGAEIKKLEATTALVSHDDGISSVPLEQLPAELQKKIGYKTDAERAAMKEADKKAAADKAAEDAKIIAENTAASAEVWKNAPAVQANADRFYKMPKAQLLKTLGEPAKVTAGNNAQDGKFELLSYSDEKGKETFFTIWERDGFVSFGKFKGLFFQSPNAPTKDELLGEIKRMKEKEEVRRGIIETLRKAGREAQARDGK